LADNIRTKTKENIVLTVEIEKELSLFLYEISGKVV